MDRVSLLEPVQSSSTEEEGVLPLDNSSVSMMNCETITSNKNISVILKIIIQYCIYINHKITIYLFIYNFFFRMYLTHPQCP